MTYSFNNILVKITDIKIKNDGRSRSLGWLMKSNLLIFWAMLVFQIFSGLLIRVINGITINIGKVSEMPSNKENSIRKRIYKYYLYCQFYIDLLNDWIGIIFRDS